MKQPRQRPIEDLEDTLHEIGEELRHVLYHAVVEIPAYYAYLRSYAVLEATEREK